jgi:hypothetical protein
MHNLAGARQKIPIQGMDSIRERRLVQLLKRNARWIAENQGKAHERCGRNRIINQRAQDAIEILSATIEADSQPLNDSRLVRPRVLLDAGHIARRRTVSSTANLDCAFVAESPSRPTAQSNTSYTYLPCS